VLTFVSEIGDKTFILVTIYAAKMKLLLLFLVSSFGMLTMHCLSTLLGSVFMLFVPKLWIQIVTILLFWGMGGVALYQGFSKMCRKKKEDDSESSDEAAELAAAIEENELEYIRSKNQAQGVEVSTGGGAVDKPSTQNTSSANV
jgi:Ca2+/H+ antiporter, TMEM165/GDT1 family